MAAKASVSAAADAGDRSSSPEPPSLAEWDLEKLGRERPKAFKSAWHELGFLVSVLSSNILAVRCRRPRPRERERERERERDD